MSSKDDQDEILESIVEEFSAALRTGQSPAIAEYQRRHPELATEIEDLLSSIVMLQQVKSANLGSHSARSRLESICHLEQIGPYKIRGEVGRGGMGVVFAASHEGLGRKVAIKVLPTPALDAGSTIERFRREAQAAARLHHTNIVSVFEAGEGAGYHYYVMDFVDGQNLAEVVAGLKLSEPGDSSPKAASARVENIPIGNRTEPATQLPATSTERIRWAARLAAQMADALSYAHSANVLHRDIKPGNMILDRSGRVWLTDFGLAKDFSQNSDLTRSGDVIGTPQYLPPESLEHRYDERSEIYGLGLLLYELVSLKPAYTGSSPAELIRAIALQPPSPIAKLVREIPVDLQTIIEKCLSRDPRHRYQTALELYRDLVAFIEDRPIAARRPSMVESTIRWAKRNPLAAGLSATSACLVCLVAVSASIGYFTTTSALRQQALISNSLRIQQQATEEARVQAEKNYIDMRAQFARAESNVGLSIQAFDEMFRHVIARGSKQSVAEDLNGLKEISGIETSVTSEDAKFLQGMLKFYEQFAQQNAENLSLRAESAKAYRRVGNINQIVGQLGPAIDAYEKSLQLLPTLADRPRDWLKEELLTRIRTQNELSSAHRLNGSLPRALELNQKSIRLLQNAIAQAPDPELQLELARTQIATGFDVLRAVSSVWKPGQARPGSNEQRPALELARRNWERLNRPMVFQAISLLDELIAADPENNEYLGVRASCDWCLAAADLETDRDHGFEHRNKAISVFTQLAQKDADNPEYQYLLALACSLTLADADTEEQKLIERGASITSKLIEQYPSVLDYHHLHAKLRLKLAAYDIQQKHRESAFQQLQAAMVSVVILMNRSYSERSFAITKSALVRDLKQLEKLCRESGNPRIAAEINQTLQLLAQTRIRTKPL
jgi:eukaryotic-like serine/threonine-protein kinase